MQECIQANCQVREDKIERLYRRLTEATNPQAKNEILKELELLTGVKIFY